MTTFLQTAAFVAASTVLPAAAQVFRCADAAGAVSYQGQPCSGGARQSEVRLPAPPPPPAPVAAAATGAAPVEPPVLFIYYDARLQPPQWTEQAMEGAIRRALSAWSAGCRVILSYAGRVRPGATIDAKGVTIRWDLTYRYLSHPADGRAGIGGSGSLSDGIRLHPDLDEAAMPRILVHEMGHVLGLPHNHDDRLSVMSYLQEARHRQHAQPSAGDIEACNQSMQRVASGKPAKPAGFDPARMNDGEALEKMRTRQR